LSIAVSILHYSTTPILPQKDSDINNPLSGVTQSRALRTRIFTTLAKNGGDHWSKKYMEGEK